MLEYVTRPLVDKSWYLPGLREVSNFTATWVQTLDLLEREIDMVGGRDVVIEVDVAPSNIRNDGMIKSGALNYSPGAVVKFTTSKHGDLIYRTDRFERGPTTRWRGGKSVEVMRGDWQHNVRAIALGLEALRLASRYGIGQSDQQYLGYKAIGAGSGTGIASGMTSSDAEAHLLRVSETPHWPQAPEGRALMVKRAKRATHPDGNGGDGAQWRLTEQAVEVLTRAGRLP